MTAFPILHEPLRDGTFALRLSAERDIPEVLIAYEDDPNLHRSLGEERPPSGAQLGRRAELAETERRAGVALTFAVVGQDDVCRGEVRVHSLDWQNLRAELSIWIAAGHRGRGLGRGALALAGRWLLGEACLERVGLMSAPADSALIGAAQAAGFHREGLLRGYVIENDERVDRVALSLVPRDLIP